MLDKNEQNISDISNSTINQANGNIINKGVSVKDVLDIVSCVVADKMTIYQQQAEFTAQQRLNDFKQKLVDELKGKGEDTFKRFNQPSVQVAARKAALGYVQSGEIEDKDNLVDLLIERVSVEEKTTKQHLIDEAIEILPSLSIECLRLLTFMAFADLMKQGTVSDYEKWIDSVNPIIEKYLQQLGLMLIFLIRQIALIVWEVFIILHLLLKINLKLVICCLGTAHLKILWINCY